MMLSNEAGVVGQPAPHPFWYTHVLGIFHVEARDSAVSGAKYKRHELLWVRWYSRNTEHLSGWEAKRLDSLSFEPHGPEHPHAFGFVDPADVIRGAHIIPGFAHGRCMDGLPEASLGGHIGGDWNQYYVNR